LALEPLTGDNSRGIPQTHSRAEMAGKGTCLSYNEVVVNYSCETSNITGSSLQEPIFNNYGSKSTKKCG